MKNIDRYEINSACPDATDPKANRRLSVYYADCEESENCLDCWKKFIKWLLEEVEENGQ